MKKLFLTVAFVLVGLSLSAQLDTVNIGTAPNAKNGDPLRTAFIKINAAIKLLNSFSTSITLPPLTLIPELPENYTPDTLLTLYHGQVYFTTRDKLSDIIYPVLPPSVTSGSYYVAPNGSDSNPGTYSSPFLTWDFAFNQLEAGDTLYVRGGTYTGVKGVYSGQYFGVRVSARSGTISDSIKVLAYPGEVPVLDCSALTAYAGEHYGISIQYSEYWRIEGLTLKSVHEYTNGSTYPYTGTGWELSDATDIVLRRCTVTDCINGFSLSGSVDNIFYIDCDAHHNYDYFDQGGLANGFNGNIQDGNHVYYTGCRAWSNSDDGYDNMGGGGYIIYLNCWAWRNGYDNPTIGNGDGFKLGFSTYGDEAGSQRTLYNCISANNYSMGFDESMDMATSMDMEVYNCISFNNNTDYGFRFSQPLGTGVTTLMNNISFLSRTGNDYEGRARNVSAHNNWDVATGVTVTNADFVNRDYTQLATTRNANGSLPTITFLHLAAGSDLIDAGIDISEPYNGAAPDLGPFESNY
jgi:hypothetical protein